MKRMMISGFGCPRESWLAFLGPDTNVLTLHDALQLNTRLTLLNAAFRDFSVLRNPHPFLMQLLSWKQVTQLITASGGDVDPELQPWFPTIRAVYRGVIAASCTRAFQKVSLDCNLGFPAQIIVSSNDPYTSLARLRGIHDDFLIPHLHVLEYGHFPYSAATNEIVQHSIHNFEAISRARHAKKS